jgi:hypothetical protein
MGNECGEKEGKKNGTKGIQEGKKEGERLRYEINHSPFSFIGLYTQVLYNR